MITKGFGGSTLVTRGMGSQAIRVLRREVIRLKSIITRILNLGSRT